MLEFIITLIACHFIADFPMQSDFLVLNKGKSWEINFYHAIIYASTFILFAHVSLSFAILLFVSHFIIDPMKARYKIIKPIWQDQILHFIVIAIGVLIGL
jgi:hypothetical protein